MIDPTQGKNVPDMPNELNYALVYALNHGRDLVNDGKMIVPFTVLLVGEKPFIQTHQGKTTTECYNMAKHEVEGARGAQAYALCYDGYLETEDGMADCIIAEGGVPGAETGYAIGYPYSLDEAGKPKVATIASFIGKAPNFMQALGKAPEEIADIDAWADEALAAETADTAGIAASAATAGTQDDTKEGGTMTDEKKTQEGEEINTFKDGEILEDDNAKDFGEPVKE